MSLDDIISSIDNTDKNNDPMISTKDLEQQYINNKDPKN
jgi:hypothetical protein